MFVYLILYILPFPLSVIPFFGYIYQPLHVLFASVVDIAGPWILGDYYTLAHIENGSGDTSYKYAEAIILLAVAGIATTLWMFFDRMRFKERTWSLGLEVLLRYYLAASLFGYGFSKVIPAQFPLPTIEMLSRTYGESSPMGLLWTFMGASPAYTILAGVSEVLAAALLLFRRTTLPGAILASFVMANVFALNLFYDVPVKLYSFHLLWMSVFLMVSHGDELLYTWKGKSLHPVFQGGKRSRLIRLTVKVLLVGVMIIPNLIYVIDQKQKQASYYMRKDSIVGEYDVSSFTINNTPLSQATDNSRRWKKLLISNSIVQIVYADGFPVSWYCAIRNGAKKIHVASKDLTTTGEFTFTLHDESLHLNGLLYQDSIQVTAVRSSANASLLLGRKFQWITEEPYNR